MASANRGLLISCRGSLGSGPGLRANSQPQAARVPLSSHLHSKPPRPPSVMRGFISRVCFSRGRMAGPLLASGVCSEQEEGEAEGEGRTRQASLLRLCGWPAAGLPWAPWPGVGGRKGCALRLSAGQRATRVLLSPSFFPDLL